MTGKIKTLTEKGYGFISMGKGEKDMFFHLRELNGVSFNELRVNDVVSFDVVQSDRGPHAVNVVLGSEESE